MHNDYREIAIEKLNYAKLDAQLHFDVLDSDTTKTAKRKAIVAIRKQLKENYVPKGIIAYATELLNERLEELA